MASVTIRNIDDGVIAALKAQARANHRSLEDETRHVLSRLAIQRRCVEEFRERVEPFPTHKHPDLHSGGHSHTNGGPPAGDAVPNPFRRARAD